MRLPLPRPDMLVHVDYNRATVPRQVFGVATQHAAPADFRNFRIGKYAGQAHQIRPLTAPRPHNSQTQTLPQAVTRGTICVHRRRTRAAQKMNNCENQKTGW